MNNFTHIIDSKLIIADFHWVLRNRARISIPHNFLLQHNIGYGLLGTSLNQVSTNIPSPDPLTRLHILPLINTHIWRNLLLLIFLRLLLLHNSLDIFITFTLLLTSLLQLFVLSLHLNDIIMTLLFLQPFQNDYILWVYLMFPDSLCASHSTRLGWYWTLRRRYYRGLFSLLLV